MTSGQQSTLLVATTSIAAVTTSTAATETTLQALSESSIAADAVADENVVLQAAMLAAFPAGVTEWCEKEMYAELLNFQMKGG